MIYCLFLVTSKTTYEGLYIQVSNTNVQKKICMDFQFP